MATSLQVIDQQKSLSRGVSFAPTNFKEALSFAEYIAQSDVVPKQYKGRPADILVAMQYGAEIGFQPLQSLNAICVINGRPGLFGDGFLGLILSQPDCEDVEEDDLPEIEASGKATCVIHRRGRKPVKRTFTLAMATAAGLTTKDGPWKTYRARQLQMRARGFCGRDAYADVMRGIKIDAELDDYELAPALPSLPAPSAAPALQKPDLPITQDEAREFGKAWKAAGHAIDEAKAFLKEKIGVESSLKIPESKYESAMTWARTPKEAAPGVEEKPSRDKDICFDLFKILGYDDVKQAAAIKEHASDWAKLAIALNKELPAEE